MRFGGVLGDQIESSAGGRASRNQRFADVAQLVAHHLAKVRVAGSNPVVRSRERLSAAAFPSCRCAGDSLGWQPASGRVVRPHPAAWPSGLGKGLQSPVRGFDSRRRLAAHNAAHRGAYRAISSVGEHYLDTVEVTGSIPVSPTIVRHETGPDGTRRHEGSTSFDWRMSTMSARCQRLGLGIWASGLH